MRIHSPILSLALAIPLLSTPGEAQRGVSTPAAASAPTVIPALVPFSGVAAGADGKPLSGEVSMTFLIYKEEQGGEPLWVESQSVATDATGHYKVQLGATNADGLPATLFASGEARWLEVQIAGEPAQARMLLASVPYALKAADAATLGGLPASAFALADRNVAVANATSAAITPNAATAVTTIGGTANKLAKFSGASTIINSILYDNGTDVGVGTTTPIATLDVDGSLNVDGATNLNGQVTLPAIGTATASADYDSQSLKINTSVYNSSTKAAVAPRFVLQAEPTGNNTASPNATLNLLASATSTYPGETGLYINTNGIITFASGQTFPATSSTGTALSGTSSSGIAIQGTSGSGTGVQGVSTYSYGVEGSSTTAPGVLGYTAGGTLNSGGVVGQAGGTSGYGGIAGVWGDAYSHVGVLGTSHTYAGVQGTSTAAQGVLGSSTTGVGVQGSSTSQNGVYGFSSNTSGVHGETQSTSTGDAAVYGGSDSVATGVIGISTNGTGVEGVSTNSWAGRFQNSSAAAAVYATNAASSGGSALYGVASGTSGIGLYTNATASNGTGVEAFADGNAVNGISNGDVLNTAGVLGVAGSRTGVNGIAGVWGDAQEHVGVIGSSKDYSGVYGASTNSYGIQGFTASGANVAAVYGVGVASTGPNEGSGAIGVWGDITGASEGNAAVVGTATDAGGGDFSNNSPNLAALTAYNYNDGGGISSNVMFKTFEASTPNGTCGFGGNGDMTCTGQLKSLATTGNGARTVETYSMQSPENWMEDFGSGTLKKGVTTVPIDPAFAETVSGDADYRVFLTPQGDSKGLYVTNKTATSFEVHESGGGTSAIAFDYRIVAKRRGLETQRMVDVTEAMKAVKARNDLRAERVKQARR